MGERPKTKSAAHRFGFGPCPDCNPDGLPVEKIFRPCAWCYIVEDGVGRYQRFVTKDVIKRWRKEHGLPEDDEDDMPTIPESRQALTNPPKLEKEGSTSTNILGGYDALPETEPAPPTLKNS